jgi:hypothetical protein
MIFCLTICGVQPMSERTPEQHRADVISAALEELPELIRAAWMLRARIEIIAGSLGGDASDVPDPLFMAHAVPKVLQEAQESLRDLASTHPIRGLDYGDA